MQQTCSAPLPDLSRQAEIEFVAARRPGNQLIYRDMEANLTIVTRGRPWSLDGDGALFRVVAEANRLRLAHLFVPVLAVHTSLVEPLPHQITAVYVL